MKFFSDIFKRSTISVFDFLEYHIKIHRCLFRHHYCSWRKERRKRKLDFLKLIREALHYDRKDKKVNFIELKKLREDSRFVDGFWRQNPDLMICVFYRKVIKYKGWECRLIFCQFSWKRNQSKRSKRSGWGNVSQYFDSIVNIFLWKSNQHQTKCLSFLIDCCRASCMKLNSDLYDVNILINFESNWI